MSKTLKLDRTACGDATDEEFAALQAAREMGHLYVSTRSRNWIYTTPRPESFIGRLPVDALRAAVALRGDRAFHGRS